MKVLYTAILLIVTTLIGKSQGIEFYDGTWQDAVNEAKLQGKLVFVDAYTTWCGPCKRMAKNVFTQEKAGSFFNANFINVKVDMEKPNGREFGSKYPVSAYPTLIFLDATGKLIKKSVGGKQVEALVNLGSEVLSKHDFSLGFREKYENGDHSYDNVVAYVAALNKSNKSSLKIANDFLIANPNLEEKKKIEFLFAATSEVDSRIFDMLKENKAKVIATYGEDAYQEKVVYAAKKTMKKANDFEDDGLYKLALKTVKKEAKPLYIGFASDAELKKAKQLRDIKGYIKASKKWLSVNNNISKKIDWSRRSLNDFPNSNELDQFIYKTLKKDLESSKDKNHITNYVKLLAKMGKKDEAIEYLEKAEKRITEVKDKNHISNLKRYIEKA